jgi:phenylpropionate dioxygenase-like ring-hydroxylating dioxygenase large terminal subunit
VSRYPFPATPDGWYGLCLASELPRGAVQALRYFGRELVAFRGEDGGARVFDAHCPHLGAHLGVGGRVEGSGIRCPFHGWRFDGEGCLAEVPGLQRTPPGVTAKSYPVRERNGFVHVWFHAQGEAPAYEVRDFLGDPALWTPWRANTYRVRVHIQDMSENILDRAHFLHVHDMQKPKAEHFEARFDGPFMVVEQKLSVTAVSAQGVEILSKTTNCGPGVSVTEVHQGPLHMINYITQTPIDDEWTDVRLHFAMKRLPDEAASRAVALLNDRITQDQFRQDVPIWENRKYLEKPRLTSVDGPVAQYRRWFSQFYSGWRPEGEVRP